MIGVLLRLACILICLSANCQGKTNDEFFYLLGRAALKAGNHNGAVTNFTKALDRNDRYADAYLGRGMSKWWLQDYLGAISDYDKAIRLNPKCGGYYCNRGQAKLSLKMIPEALSDYTKAIELDPQNAQAYYNRGTLKFLCLSNSTDAVMDFTKAIDLHNDSHEEDIFYWRGNARLELKDYAGAVADYTKAIQLNPDKARFESTIEANLLLAQRLLRESKQNK